MISSRSLIILPFLFRYKVYFELTFLFCGVLQIHSFKIDLIILVAFVERLLSPSHNHSIPVENQVNINGMAYFRALMFVCKCNEFISVL